MSDLFPKPGDGGTTEHASPFATNGSSITTAAAEPEAPKLSGERTHGKKFVFLYSTLGAVAALGITAFFLVDHHSNGGNASGWSSWKPTNGSTAQITSQIADHVSHQYHLNSKGTQLLAVVAGPPTVTSGTHKITISNIAVQNVKPGKSIDIVNSGGTWVDNFCGLTPSCAIGNGKATIQRGRLVRREALEVALYTFKFVPSIKAVLAFMPPPPGGGSTLLYLQRSDLQKQLSEPLSKTLPLNDPPLPSQADNQEAKTIDKLTLPAIYKFQYQQLQDASALLVLNPFKT